MEFEKEIKRLVRQSIMNEINGLSLRATIKDIVVSTSEITKEDANKLIKETIDSYVRSVRIAEIVDKLINELVRDTVKSEIKKYITGYFSNTPTALLEKVIKDEIMAEWRNNYTAKVSITKKEG